jgi:hypothetical protein
VRQIQFSLFTPQIGETSREILSPELRRRAVRELDRLRRLFPMLRLNGRMLEAMLNPPANPSVCAFARLTTTVSADLKSRIEPCQFGGRPDCSQCGCLATMGLEAVLQYRLAAGIRVKGLFEASMAVGEAIRNAWPGRRQATAEGGFVSPASAKIDGSP